MDGIAMNRVPDRPTTCELACALALVGRVLGERHAYRVGQRFFFPLGGRWFVAVSPDDAGRIRVEACYGTAPVASLWTITGDRDRLAGLIREIRTELAALAA